MVGRNSSHISVLLFQAPLCGAAVKRRGSHEFLEVSPAEPTKSVFEKRKMEGCHKEPPGSTLKEVDALDMTAHERQHIFLWGVSGKKLRTEDDIMIKILFLPTQKFEK